MSQSPSFANFSVPPFLSEGLTTLVDAALKPLALVWVPGCSLLPAPPPPPQAASTSAAETPTAAKLLARQDLEWFIPESLLVCRGFAPMVIPIDLLVDRGHRAAHRRTD